MVATLDQLENMTEKPRRDHRGPYMTERGVVLKYVKVSIDTVRKAWTAIPVPKPPMVYIEDRGRDEPNPADPGYQNELNQYTNKVNLIIHTLYFMRGVDVFSKPEDLPGPESEEWYEGLEEYFEIPKGKLARKAVWLMDFILNDQEKDEILEDLLVFSGYVTEKVVDEAINSFRSDSIQETDTELSNN